MLLVHTALVTATFSHGISPNGWPVNPALGVAGFPDCVRRHPSLALGMEAAGMDLICAQRAASSSTTIHIATVGDSITAGVHSSGGNHTYPAQLQILLDAAHGWGAYSVTNLGACGSTMQKNADSPFWKRPQYAALLNGTWDVITILLGTNDAKDKASGGPSDWTHQCGQLEGCAFADDFASFIAVASTLGRGGNSPLIYAMVPPPLMKQGAYGMNETVINTVLPALIPLIAARAASTVNKSHPVRMAKAPIDLYAAMGGVKDWKTAEPTAGCALSSAWKPCKWWCDAQSCDQCHPNDNGYAHLAEALFHGISAELPAPTSPPKPLPSPTSPAGAWLFEAGGSGRLFIPAANFTPNTNSGRKGARAWDARKGGVGAIKFDNGDPVFAPQAGGPHGVAAVLATGSIGKLRGATGCGKSYNYPNMSVSYEFGAADGLRYEGWLYLELEN